MAGPVGQDTATAPARESAGPPAEPSAGAARLGRLIAAALRVADPARRYDYTERILAEVLALRLPGWDASQAARVRLQDALAAARGQAQPIAAAIANIRARGELTLSRESVFDDFSDDEE